MKKIIVASVLLMSCFSMAEDIELYVGNAAQRKGADPKILIIFDNSSSMDTGLEGRPAFDPTIDYPANGSLNDGGFSMVYFTKGVGIDNTTLPVPDSPNERRRFLDSINNCASSWQILHDVGFYTGFIKEYNRGSWQTLRENNGANYDKMDCFADLDKGIVENAEGEVLGLPVDGHTSAWGAPSVGTKPIMDSGEKVTLWSENYLRWAVASEAFFDSIDVDPTAPTPSRLQRAKTTITDFIESNSHIDFGLQVFNVNYLGENEKDGGRIVFDIQDMDSTATTTILDIIDNQLDAETSTPLCESLYEASLYFGGKAVDFGDDDRNVDTYRANTPPRDLNAETSTTSNVYDSPFDGCTQQIYTLLITDGAPFDDNAANNKIDGLTPTTYTSVITTDDEGIELAVPITETVTSHLASLAYYMRTHDLINGEAATAKEIERDDFSRIRNSTLSTIAFDFPQGAIADDDPVGAQLLKDAANKGGGQYYDATTAGALRDALNDFVFKVSQTNGSFTSPAVATNNFDRTRTLDSVYYAMFEPNAGPRWSGNLKKLKVTLDGIEDQNNISAINTAGNIADSALTYWTTGPADGNTVTEGGVAQMFRTKEDRRVLSDVKLDNGKLLALNQANALNTYTTTTALADELNVIDDDAHQNIDDMLNWAKGQDVDDEDDDTLTDDIRADVFGDPLHSKPLVINYGTPGNEDIRIVIGTNAGVLHMFKDEGTRVDEAWAFMPKEFLKNISTLRENIASETKLYGIDGTPVVYISDENGNGAVDGTDKVWLFFGLRRGGNSYYAVDITVKDEPKLMWHKTFAGAGQSWSKPKISLSKINTSAKPVLIFGAGYATSKDNSGVGGNDLVGQGIYMVDAQTGDLVWRLSPDAGLSDKTTPFAGTDSIPGGIGLLDSDADGFVDRLYAGDTGGNVWRVDMPGTTISDWTVFKLASLGSPVDNENNEDDRRFFSAPTVVRALITETVTSTVIDELGAEVVTVDRYDRPYEAVLIGSGDTTNPTGTDTDDKFFMIKDSHIYTKSFVGDDIPTVIELDALKDYTLNPFQGLTGENLSDAQKASLLAAQLDASSKSGWYIDLTGSGEKNTSSSLVYAGVVYFNTYTPAAPIEGEQVCTAKPGGGLLYAVDLALGTNIFDTRTINNGNQVTGTPTLVVLEPPVVGEPVECVVDCDPITPPEPNVPGIIAPDFKKVPGSPPLTLRTYLYTTEK